MHTTLLSVDAFRATYAAPMRDVTSEETDVIDIWPYVESVPSADLLGHSIFDEFVEYVYRSADDRFDHVLVMTKTTNVYLAVVVDLIESRIHGHYLLDLNKEYGLEPPAQA
jgi:hypothetical protein